MAHKVICTNPNGTRSEFQFENFVDAEILAFNTWSSTGTFEGAMVCPDHTLFTKLTDYVDALNLESKFVEEDAVPGLWACSLADDPAHWAEVGVHTPADLARYLAIECYHNVHKEVRGFRPCEDLSALSIDQISAKTHQVAELAMADDW